MTIESNDIKRWLASASSMSGAAKNKNMIAYIIKLASKPKRQRVSVNLNKLERYVKNGENIIVPGKVLGVGRISKKINISAMRYSGSALQKLKASSCTIVGIKDMVSKEGVRVII